MYQSLATVWNFAASVCHICFLVASLLTAVAFLKRYYRYQGDQVKCKLSIQYYEINAQYLKYVMFAKDMLWNLSVMEMLYSRHICWKLLKFTSL